MPSEKNIFIVNVLARIQQEDQFLLIQRSKNDKRMPGAWHIPGGKVDYENETNILEKNIMREIQEEVGINVKDIQYVCSSADMIGEYQVLSICFHATRKSGEGRLCLEIDDVKRFPFEEISSMERNRLLEKMYNGLKDFLDSKRT